MKCLVCLAVLVLPTIALAQPAPPPPPPGAGLEAPGAQGPKLWGGGDLELLPFGSFSGSSGGTSSSVSTAVAFGIGARIDYRISPLFSIGFAPRYVLNVKGQNSTDSASMLDLRVRGTVGQMVAPLIRLYGFGALGFADVLLPSSANGVSNPTGLTVTIGGGAGYMLSPRAMVVGELGYEFGFEGTSYMGQSADFKVSYLEFDAGIVIALGQ